jgi:adenylosuccinate synthase
MASLSETADVVTLLVQVKGGTNAGRRIVREPKIAWIHLCPDAVMRGGRVLDAGYRRCPDCGQARP